MVDHGDPVAHRERLFLVVGHVHERDADLRLQLLQLHLQLAPQLGVEGAERLVEQQHRGLEHQGAGQGDALLLPAGELAGLARRVARQLHELQRLADAPPDLGLGARRARRSPNATLSKTRRCGNSA